MCTENNLWIYKFFRYVIKFKLLFVLFNNTVNGTDFLHL